MFMAFRMYHSCWGEGKEGVGREEEMMNQRMREGRIGNRRMKRKMMQQEQEEEEERRKMEQMEEGIVEECEEIDDYDDDGDHICGGY